MEKLKVHIDILAYPDKTKAKEEFGIIKNRTQNKNTIQEVEITELMEKIGQGYAISPSVMNGTKAINWLEQQLFMIDIDNKEDKTILSIKKALDICKANNILPAFYYFTYSSTKKIPRYRLAFIMEVPIKDIDTREKAINTLISLFPNSDKSCNTACTIFLGTNNPVIKYKLDSRIDTKYLLSLANMEIMEDKTNKKYSKDSELEQLKDNFPLLDLMVEDNGGYKDYGSYIQFKNCNICGHYDCLTYYKDYNTWYCFGASSCKGGSIIDYLMYRDSLSLKQAIDKFKYELCHLEKKEVSNKLVCCSIKELQAKKLPPLIYYVKGLIPQGENILCSSPKIGKSWLSLDICLSISQGLPILGFETTKASCLYLDLENSEVKLQARVNKLLDGAPAPDNFYYSIHSSNLSMGFIKELEDCLKEHPDIKVIVIDTLQKIRGASKSNNAYANDYEDLSMIKSFADTNSLCIIIVHHLRKAKDSTDIFDRVSGTNGITGTADTTLILSKSSRSDTNTTLSVVGRDVDFNEYIIKFNKDTCKWEMICDSQTQIEEYKRNLYNNSKIVILIKDILKDTDTWSGTINEINELYKEKFGKLYIEKERVSSLGNAVKKLAPQLLEYDNIVYTPPPKDPSNGTRKAKLKKE